MEGIEAHRLQEDVPLPLFLLHCSSQQAVRSYFKLQVLSSFPNSPLTSLLQASRYPCSGWPCLSPLPKHKILKSRTAS